MKTVGCLIGLFGALVASDVRADVGARLYERGRAGYFSARTVSNAKIKESQLKQAASDLRKFVESFPTHPRIPAALFNLGSAYADLSDLTVDRDAATRAIHFFRDLVARYPKDRLADDALVQVAGVCRRVFRDEKCTEEAFARVRANYPSGDMITRLLETEMPEPAATGPGELAGFDVARENGVFVVSFHLGTPKDVTGKLLPADPVENLPERFYADLNGIGLASGVGATHALNPEDPVRQLRFGVNGSFLRIVVDLAPDVSGSGVSAKSSPDGFQIRVASGEPPTPAPSPEPVAAVSPTPAAVLAAEPVLLPKAPGRRRIVLDAGHGGEDVGAIGKRGTLEKEICLMLVRRVDELLRKRPEYAVFLTRRDDRFIPLSERTKLGNAWNGELFVSVHANASPRRGAEGVSTYFLDNHDDEEALRVAMRENTEPGALPPGVSGTSESQYLAIMKASMVKNFHTVLSTELAQNIQVNLVRRLRSQFSGVTDLGVKSARFFVLMGAQMPAILVESSFISNPQEEKRLRDRRYQKLLAEAIVRGIDEFFRSSVGRGDHAALFQH